MLKQSYQLEDNDYSINAMYVEQEDGKMKMERLWYLPICEYLEKSSKGSILVNPYDKLKEMEDRVKELKAQSKQVIVKLVYLNENGKCDYKKSYPNYKSCIRN